MIDMRENRPEYNGFVGNQYWEAMYFHVKNQEAVKKLLSGAHASLNMHLASTHIERMQNLPGTMIP